MQLTAIGYFPGTACVLVSVYLLDLPVLYPTLCQYIQRLNNVFAYTTEGLKQHLWRLQNEVMTVVEFDNLAVCIP